MENDSHTMVMLSCGINAIQICNETSELDENCGNPAKNIKHCATRRQRRRALKFDAISSTLTDFSTSACRNNHTEHSNISPSGSSSSSPFLPSDKLQSETYKNLPESKSSITRDSFESELDHQLEENVKFAELSAINATFEMVQRSKRKRRNRTRPDLVSYFANSASNSSLASLASSSISSSGIDTADSSQIPADAIKEEPINRVSSGGLYLKNLTHSYKTNSIDERDDTSPSIPDSTTSSSIGFGDDNSEESPRSSSSAISTTKTSCMSEMDQQQQNLYITISQGTEYFNTNDNVKGTYRSNNYLIYDQLNYYPIFFNNFNAAHEQQQREIESLLSNPNVEKFYNEQREYYRRIYERQFAACGSVVLRGKPCFFRFIDASKITEQERSSAKNNQKQPILSVEPSTSTYDYSACNFANNNTRKRVNYMATARAHGKKCLSKNSNRLNRESYCQAHKHLGFPIQLPYTALGSWQTLGLENPYYLIYWQQLNEKNKLQMYAQIQYTTVDAEAYKAIYGISVKWGSTSSTFIANRLGEYNKNNQFNENTKINEKANESENHTMDISSIVPVAMTNPLKCCSNGSSADGFCDDDNGTDLLGEQIIGFHQSVEQRLVTLNRKLNLRDMLYHTIAPIFPMCGLYIVGSSLNGFGSNKSDMDLCLMITNRDIDQRSDAVIVLQSIMRTLQTTSFVANQQLILAKVPILRINFHSAFSDITVDLNANNSVAIRNTHLLCYYSSFDWRVRPLVSVVKEWAKRRGINDANRSSFTSYSLVLMVIHYLQCGTSPPVLPSLQQMYPKYFSQNVDVRQLNVGLQLLPPPATLWVFSDRLMLSELLLGFFRYYAFSFNFDTDAISIRLGRKTERALVARNRSPYNHLSQWHCICIEEPFTFSNTAHSVYDERIFNSIKKAFVDALHQLEAKPDLDAFFHAADAGGDMGAAL